MSEYLPIAVLAMQMAVMALAISKEEWDKLPPEKQKEIQKPFIEAIENARQVHKGENPENPEDEYHHVRLKDPTQFDPESFRVVAFGKGIKATIGCPKGKFEAGKCKVGTQTQKILFPKDKYSEEEAQTWVRKHPKLKLKKKK